MNYIVSGLERSGTSLMMQILKESKFPIKYDEKRKPDKHNPKGYYEIDRGLVINKLINNKFNPNLYKEKAIKVTSYGLRYLPKGEYKVLYMVRDIYEVWKSQEKMRNKMVKFNLSDERMREILGKMRDEAISIMENRDDIDYLLVSYNDLIFSSNNELKKISKFLNFDVSLGLKVIDNSLYRSRLSDNLEVKLSEEEKEIIEKRLKELGYME